MTTRTYILFLFLFLQLSSFGQQTEVAIKFNHTTSGEPVVLNETTFQTEGGKVMNIQRAQFYISQIKLVQSDGSVVALDDQYILADASNTNDVWQVGTYDLGTVTKIQLGIGVDESVNHLDPTTYPDTHPLAIQDPSMHWGWAAGYRFLVIEGKIDTDNDNTPNEFYQYHCLEDILYKEIELSCSLVPSDGALTIEIDVDYQKLFNQIPLDEFYIYHGSLGPNAIMMSNAAREGFLSVSGTVGETTPQPSIGLNIFPNPVQGKEVTLEYSIPADFTKSKTTNIELYNSLGQLEFSDQLDLNNNRYVFPVGGRTNGNYMLVIRQDTRVLAQKQLVISN